jgi:hypothetical protein
MKILFAAFRGSLCVCFVASFIIVSQKVVCATATVSEVIGNDLIRISGDIRGNVQPGDIVVIKDAAIMVPYGKAVLTKVFDDGATARVIDVNGKVFVGDLVINQYDTSGIYLPSPVKKSDAAPSKPTLLNERSVESDADNTSLQQNATGDEETAREPRSKPEKKKKTSKNKVVSEAPKKSAKLKPHEKKPNSNGILNQKYNSCSEGLYNSYVSNNEYTRYETYFHNEGCFK